MKTLLTSLLFLLLNISTAQKTSPVVGPDGNTTSYDVSTPNSKIPFVSQGDKSYPQPKDEVLHGEMELIVDVSNMKDTSGRFYFMIGGQRIYPVIKDGKMRVRQDLKEPRRCILSFIPRGKIMQHPDMALDEIAAEISDFFFFLGIPGRNEIVVKGTLASSQIVNPSAHQEKYISLLKLKNDYHQIFEKEHDKLTRRIENEMVQLLKDSLISVYIGLYQKESAIYYTNTILGFVRDNPNEPATLIELEEYSRTDNHDDLEMLASLYQNLTYQMKSLPMAELIKKRLGALNFRSISLGTIAPDFTQNSPEGKAISLKDFRGHITLIEFWASWCGPCRDANPGLLKVYKKYNSEGFRILGVSLDNDRTSWQKAIEQDSLIWDHVSDLKPFKNAAAELYKVAGVPTSFLIDKDGKIIAANLDANQLDAKLESLLSHLR